MTTSQQTQLSLFDAAVQPWSGNEHDYMPAQFVREREELLATLDASSLLRTEQRVAHCLHHFPETRDNDIALAIRYWRTFQSEVLEDWGQLQLEVLFELDHIETLRKYRRHIQNDLKLFRPSPKAKHWKDSMQGEFYSYLAEKRKYDPEIRFYVDVTPNDPRTGFTGIAGICVFDCGLYKAHQAAFAYWREYAGWNETLDHTSTDPAEVNKQLALLAQMRRRREGVMFMGHALAPGNYRPVVLANLVNQMIVDGLQYLKDKKEFARARAVTVYSSTDSHFDEAHMTLIERELAQSMARDFDDDTLYMRHGELMRPGDDVMLETAGLIAGGIQRSVMLPQDKLAQSVLSVTGFEQKVTDGAQYHAFL